VIGKLVLVVSINTSRQLYRSVQLIHKLNEVLHIIYKLDVSLMESLKMQS